MLHHFDNTDPLPERLERLPREARARVARLEAEIPRMESSAEDARFMAERSDDRAEYHRRQKIAQEIEVEIASLRRRIAVEAESIARYGLEVLGHRAKEPRPAPPPMRPLGEDAKGRISELRRTLDAIDYSHEDYDGWKKARRPVEAEIAQIERSAA